MTVRLAISVALCLCGGVCFAAVSQLDAEATVRRRVVQRGLRVGTDLETGAYTVIAGASMSGSTPGSSAYDARQRSKDERTRTADKPIGLNMVEPHMGFFTTALDAGSNFLARLLIFYHIWLAGVPFERRKYFF